MKHFTIATLAILGLLGGLAACGGGHVDADIGGGGDVAGDGTHVTDPGNPDTGGLDVVQNDANSDPGTRPDLVVDDPGGGIDAQDDVGQDVPMVDVPDSGPQDSGPDVCVGPWCSECEPDERLCVEVVRDPQSGECLSSIREGFCLISGECYFQLQPDLDYPCMFCVPAVDNAGFSPYPGMPCDDGEPCTIGDVCGETGVCTPGGPNPCNDENECTIDRCTKGVGCTHTVRFGAECDDGNACTSNTTCNANAECVGTMKTCRDFHTLGNGTQEPNPCTDDSCDPWTGNCVFTPNNNTCSDGNACTLNDTCVAGQCVGTRNPCDDGDPCTRDYCVDGPGGGCRNQPNYSDPCDDGDACTVDDFCDGMPPICTGYAVVCNDSNPCTTDSCDPAIGCVFTPLQGGICVPPDGGDACTFNYRCEAGECVGDPVNCDDGRPCTIDSCDPVSGCRWETNFGPCDDGDACTVGETCNSFGECGVPDPSLPQYKLDCNDRNPCTVDSCDRNLGCVHVNILGACEDGDPCSQPGTGTCVAGRCVTQKRSCDDGNPCTDDSCDPDGGCIHTVHTRTCEDGNLCTVGERCISGICQGGTARNCNDNNVCTVDACNPAVGCVYSPSTVRDCNDGSKCTINDTCANMVCTGTPVICEDYNLCTDNTCDPAVGCVFVPNNLLCDDHNVCTIEDQCSGGKCLGISLFNNPSNKAAQLSFGVSGNPGQGVNIDDDEATCAPKGYCAPGTGIDNAFATLSWLFNPEFVKAVTGGDYALLFEHEDLKTGGIPYQLNLFWGERIDPVACDPATPGCNYGVFPSDLIPPCDPRWIFDNAKIQGTTLTAGGFDYQLPVSLIFGNSRVPLMLRWARIKATVSLSSGIVVSGSGALGGWALRSEIIDGVAGIPMSDFPPPYTRDVVLQYLNLYLKADIDSDGDGTPDAVSIGMPFTLTTGEIIGPL